MRLARIDRLTDVQVGELHRLFERESWSRHRSLDDLREMLDHSDVVVGFAEPQSEELVAFARALTDRVYKAVLLDVIVAPSHRSTGLGKVVVQALIDHPRLARVQDIELCCPEYLTPFYRRLGFDGPDDGGVFLRRRQREA